MRGKSRLLRHPAWPEGRHLRVCSDCFRSKPRCRVCGLPLGADPLTGTCPTCLSSAPRCLSCGKPVTGRYRQINGQGPYCETCQPGEPACDVCGGPLGPKRWQLSDGRVSCEACHATAVYEPAQAQPLYEAVTTALQQNLGMSLNIPTGLSLVDRNQLIAIIQKQNASDIHDPEHTLGLYTRKGIRRGIYVQTGLPRLLFEQVAAHELAHAWQGENCPLMRDVLVREGFAEWSAYKVLQAQGHTAQMALMRQRADLYGQGLQWALDLETRQGWQGLIEYCRRAT